VLNANWIFADLIGLVVGIAYIVVSSAFVDDLQRGLSWTKARTYWTQARIGLSETGFRAFALCKTTISASAQTLLNAAPVLEGIRRRDAVLVGCSGLKLSKSAVWCELRVRRWGERFLPHAAVGPIQLKPTQQRAVAALTADSASELTRGQYEELAGVSRSQAAYDLADLVEAGILERIGNGRATRYRLARVGGTQRRWTSDRIQTELEAFCAGRKTWPSAADFKAAGRGDLYVAASRYGGIGHWTERLGFPRPTRGARTVRQPALFRTKLVWAGSGALAALCLAVAAGAVLLTTRHSARVANPTDALRQEAVTSDESIHPAMTQAVEPRAARPHRTHQQRARHAPPASSRRGSSSVSRSLAASRISQPSAASALVNRTFSAATASSWPAPLRAPSGGSPPAPLKAP
jgi:hypothetical protein